MKPQQEYAAVTARLVEVEDRLAELADALGLVSGPLDRWNAACRENPSLRNFDPTAAAAEQAALAGERLTLGRRKAELEKAIARDEATAKAAAMQEAIKINRAAMKDAAAALVAFSRAIFKARAARESVGWSSSTGSDPLEPIHPPGGMGSYALHEPNSNAATFLKSCVRLGHVGGNEAYLKDVKL